MYLHSCAQHIIPTPWFTYFYVSSEKCVRRRHEPSRLDAHTSRITLQPSSQSTIPVSSQRFSPASSARSVNAYHDTRIRSTEPLPISQHIPSMRACTFPSVLPSGSGAALINTPFLTNEDVRRVKGTSHESLGRTLRLKCYGAVVPLDSRSRCLLVIRSLEVAELSA